MLSRKELEKLVEKHDAAAVRAYRNYNDTGIQRYDRERRKNEDYADAFRMALNAENDYTKLVQLRSDFVRLAGQARRAGTPEDAQKVCRDLLATAKLLNLISGED